MNDAISINERKIIEKFPDYKEPIMPFIELLQAQHESYNRLNLPLFPNEDDKRRQQARDEYFPWLRRTEIPIDLNEGIRLFKKLGDIFEDSNPKFRNDIPNIMKIVDEGFFKETVDSLLSDDWEKLNRLIKKASCDKSSLIFLGYHSIYPSIRKVRKNLSTKLKLTEEHWPEGYCPLCGAYPAWSKLIRQEHGSKRIYICSFCLLEWPSDRLKCPYCGSTDMEKLGYLYVEDDPNFRIDTCDNCNRYIKTINEVKNPWNFPYIITSIVTQHLDIVAQDHGYNAYRHPVGLNF